MARKEPSPDLPREPLWYKDAIIYQTHVRAFRDSNADGVGDFRGLTAALDYLEDLGITALWLLPFYPSPLKDDGYDIANYTGVHPAYGTLRDFDNFIREAHRRGIRVITELVINHTSDQHPWFQRARRAPPGSREREFYVWSDTPEKYKGVRVIFKDFEPSNWSADPLVGQYYWHRFYSHQPDLNFDNPRVERAVLGVLDFWFKRGVDGLRLDAIPYLIEREGTSCENLPETHAILKRIRRHVDERFADRMLLAEANQWPEDVVAYFGDGDECHMAFNFPVMPRLFMALRMGDRYPIVDIMRQTPPIPEQAQWAIFLRNHDELTLEMVTDRERDYMYQVYARDRAMRLNLGIRRRLAPLLGNERRSIELMNSLLFSLPGTPIIYYGDEIGMGDNVYLGDRNGVRTPMQWSADRNAGFSRASPQRLYLPVITGSEYHYEAVNVEAQLNNPRSLLWWMKRKLQVRKHYRAFGRGTLRFLEAPNPKVLAFLREYASERLLIVANLSRFPQAVDLELDGYAGWQPVELLGRTAFPAVTAAPYRMMVGAYGYYWFVLEPRNPEPITMAGSTGEPLPELTVNDSWEQAFQPRARGALERLLPGFLCSQRWFGGQSRRIDAVHLVEAIRIAYKARVTYVLLVSVEYTDGVVETYLLPVTFLPADAPPPSVTLAALHVRGQESGFLCDAASDPVFCEMILDAVRRRRRHVGIHGELAASSTRALRGLLSSAPSLQPQIAPVQQISTSVFYGDTLIFKLYRRLQPGTNPDLEVGRYLTEHAPVAPVPPLAGALEYRHGAGEPMTVGILHGFVANQGDAWRHTLDSLSHYYEEALARVHEVAPLPLAAKEAEPPLLVQELIGFYLEQVQQLGRRVADLHVALSTGRQPEFAAELFTVPYQRAQYQAMRSSLARTLALLRERLEVLAAPERALAERVLGQEEALLRHFTMMRDGRFTALRIRIHGDLHLGQVLYTGKDFVITDFEGEPGRSLSERRAKQSALRDVATMLRSFHYASFAALFAQVELTPTARPAELESLRRLWYDWVAARFRYSYWKAAAGAPFAPATREEAQQLIEIFLLEKAVYELAYELDNRPRWASIPLWAIAEALAHSAP